jgi:subtilisin family serine protease
LCAAQLLGACLTLTPTAAFAQLVDPQGPLPSNTLDVQPRVERAFESEERVPVFILLREDTLAMDERKQAVAAALGGELELWHSYRNIPVIAGMLTRLGMTQLHKNAAVSAVQLDGTGSGGLAEAVPAVGVDKLQSVRGLTGKGVTVAVLDSGASTKHPALQGAIVAQHCFTRLGCPPSGSAQGDSAEDDHNHGSNVTGIVASRSGGGVSKGYAPGANIVAVKVLNAQNAGQTSDWVAGFDWVLTNREKHKIKVINASLVSDTEYATTAECDRGETAMAMVVKKLFDAGVTITGSSGNTGHTATMTSPSCNTGVIAVGATYDKDLGRQPENVPSYQALAGGRWPACSDAMTSNRTIACFTSTAGTRLDLLAPGSQITSAGRGTGTSLFRGTSQAAPGVAGLSALLLECNPTLTPTMILDVLKKTGEPVVDARSGMLYPLIRGVEAGDMACVALGGAVGAPGAGSAGTAAGSAGVVAAGSGAGGQSAAIGGSLGLAAGSSGIPVTSVPVGPGTGINAAGIAAGSGGPIGSVSGVAGTGVAQAGSTGQLPNAQAASSAAPPAQDSGCQCATPGALRGIAHMPGLGVLALGSLGLCLRRRQRRIRSAQSDHARLQG